MFIQGKQDSKDECFAEEPAGCAASVDERHFRAVADYTYDWESWHDPSSKLVWVNPAVERFTGYSVDECLGMTDYPLPMVAPADRARIAEILKSATRRSSGDQVDFCSLHRNGESRWMSLAWQPMYESNGEYLGFRMSVRDVTDRHNLKEQLRLHAEHLEQLVHERTARLRQLERRQQQMEKLAALGQLAAGVAHEINNPLAGMRNAFELIKSSLSPEDEHFELLELIDREIQRISDIVLQMHQLYRRHPQRSSEVSVRKILGEVICLLEMVARKRGVSFVSDFGDQPHKAHLVGGEVKQILYNLLRNAIQASPDNEAVTLQIRGDADEVTVHVHDRGPGISDEIMSRIFDPFFSTKHGGTESGMGLGLSVSRSLIEAMGGRLSVVSSRNRGTRFSAVFPRRLDATEVAADE